MNLDDQLRAVLNEEAEMRTATPPDVPGLISGGQARRRRRNALWAGAGVLAIVIAVGGAYGVAQLGDDDADPAHRIANQPTSQPLPDASESVAIDAGTYAVSEDSAGVVAPYTIKVPAGWFAQYGTDVGKHQEDVSGGGHEQGAIVIEPFALDKIQLADDTCSGEGAFGASQTSAAGLVAGLRSQGHGLRVSDPVAATVGGLPATRIDLDYPGSKPLSNCRLSDTPGVGPGVLQVWTGYFVMWPAETASVYVVDVAGRSQLFVTRTADDASSADRAELQSIVDSISFQTGAP